MVQDSNNMTKFTILFTAMIIATLAGHALWITALVNFVMYLVKDHILIPWAYTLGAGGLFLLAAAVAIYITLYIHD